MLAIALLGTHHVGAERTARHDAPVAQVGNELAPVILTAQSQPTRASAPDGDAPLAAAPVSEIATPQRTPARVAWDPAASVSIPAIHILPPVRGPPAA